MPKITDYEYIAIEGNIGVGKTSLASKIANDFNARLVLEEFAENPFLPKFYENRERYAFPLELSFLAERFAQLKKVLSTKDLFKDLVVADYFIHKCLIFSKANLQGDEYELFSKMYSIIEQSLPKPDLLIYLHVETDQLLLNIKKRGREYEQNIKAEYLEEVKESYFNFIKQHPNLNILTIDVTGMDFVNNAADYQRVISTIESFS